MITEQELNAEIEKCSNCKQNKKYFDTKKELSNINGVLCYHHYGKLEKLKGKQETLEEVEKVIDLYFDLCMGARRVPKKEELKQRLQELKAK